VRKLLIVDCRSRALQLQIYLLHRSVFRWRKPLCAHLRNSQFCSRHTRNDIFVCDEESHFYSQCLEKLLVKNSSSNQTVIEFGSGDGSPVIGCLIQSQFSGVIHGFELNEKAAALAHSRTIETHVSNRYKAGLHLQVCATMLHAVNICPRLNTRMIMKCWLIHNYCPPACHL